MSAVPHDCPALRRLVAQVQALDAWSTWLRERNAVLRSLARRTEPGEARRLTDELVYNGLEKQAVLARIDVDDHDPRAVPACPTAVLAVRQGWTSEALTRHLQDAGLAVLSVVRDGPSLTAALLVCQPTLVLAEDTLCLLEVPVLLDRARRFARETSVCVLTDRDAVAPATSPDAGVTVLSRRHDPAAVAAHALRCLSS